MAVMTIQHIRFQLLSICLTFIFVGVLRVSVSAQNNNYFSRLGYTTEDSLEWASVQEIPLNDFISTSNPNKIPETCLDYMEALIRTEELGFNRKPIPFFPLEIVRSRPHLRHILFFASSENIWILGYSFDQCIGGMSPMYYLLFQLSEQKEILSHITLNLVYETTCSGFIKKIEKGQYIVSEQHNFLITSY